MGEVESKLGQEIAQERVGHGIGDPPGPSRLLGLLEVIGERTGVDAEHPELSRLDTQGVPRPGLGFGLERLA
jgi:hypothetical protein